MGRHAKASALGVAVAALATVATVSSGTQAASRAGLAAASGAVTAASAGSGVTAAAMALARATLPAGDGWGSSGTGTTGGAAADAAHVFVVRNRGELVAALGGDNATNLGNATPKIIFVAAGIDANTDDAGKHLTCADYADPGYTLPAYLAAYDPASWGMVPPAGALEEARLRSAANQKARVQINVGPNTTIIGLKGARLLGGNLMLGTSSTSVSNIIIRDLTFVDARDCFPAWSPTDGSTGNWNSLYDNVSLFRATHVWLDHNAFSDGNDTDDKQPLYFGRPYQWHDGLSDITKGSDLVTVSYNVYAEHDKSILIGSTDSPGNPATNPGADLGRLRVTLHHNLFSNLGQRAPRVRYGQVDLYDNFYYETDEKTFTYSWGIGVGSALYAENNFFLRSADIPLDAFVYNWGGTAMTERGTLVRVGTGTVVPVSLLAAFNAANPSKALGADAGWTPVLRSGLDPTALVPARVVAGAGPGKLPLS